MGGSQPAMSVVAGEGSEPGRRSRWAMPWASMPSNRFLITADKGLNKMLVYRFDAATGALTPNQPPSAGAADRFRTASLRVSSERALAVHDQRAGGDHHQLLVGPEIGQPHRVGQRPDQTRGCHHRLDGRDRRPPQWPIRVRIQSRARQHRGLQRRRRRRAHLRRARVDARADAAELRARSHRPLADRGQSAIQHARRVQHRPDDGRADAGRTAGRRRFDRSAFSSCSDTAGSKDPALQPKNEMV